MCTRVEDQKVLVQGKTTVAEFLLQPGLQEQNWDFKCGWIIFFLKIK
jgi:hypothetical protein